MQRLNNLDDLIDCLVKKPNEKVLTKELFYEGIKVLANLKRYGLYKKVLQEIELKKMVQNYNTERYLNKELLK